jgi:pantoate--beta-alanine ligase
LKVIRTLEEMLSQPPHQGGFVPTMGAFHEGHLSLMRQAKAECSHVTVSLYVNPLQFGPNEDLARYPRQEELDFRMAADAGVDVMFAPRSDEWALASKTSVSVRGLTDVWEGAFRPGHFDGVATIVAKLFNLVRPRMAYFGLKDFQQCAVIRQMVADLDFPLQLRFCDTIRETDGLALSSRNRYLSPDDRAVAAKLFAELLRLAEAFRNLPVTEWSSELEKSIATLSELGFMVDYLAAVDKETLQIQQDSSKPTQIIVAARLGSTRLIDNLAV